MNLPLPLDEILPGDCLDILPSLPEKSIDVIFADPPYFLQLNRELRRPNMTKVDAVNDEWDKFINFEDYDRFTEFWLSACKRVLKPTGTLWVIGTYHNIYRIGKILQDLDFWILNDVIWIKDNPMPNFRGVRFTNAHETLLWAQKKRGAKYTFNHHSLKEFNDDLQMRSDWYMPVCSGRERTKINGKKGHATQKPEGLLYRILLASTRKDDIILDPFFGTGTTGAVAKKLGRHFIGIEKDPKYVRLATKRILEVNKIPDEALTLTKPRSWRRLPFGRLLEEGLIQPGQKLYFKNSDSIAATIMENGQLKYQEQIGSIHSLARSLTEREPANGWDLWFFEELNKRQPINLLRERILQTGEKHAKNP